MTWRVIVRFSLDGDNRSAVRNAVVGILLANGISRTTTGTWETQALPPAQAASCMASVLTQLASPGTVSGASAHAHLDHIWIYIDSA